MILKDGAKDGTSELAFKQVWNEVQKEVTNSPEMENVE